MWGSDHCGGCKERSLYLSKVRRIFPRACKTQNRDDHRWRFFWRMGFGSSGRKSSGIQRIRRKTEEITGKDRAFRSSCNRKSKDWRPRGGYRSLWWKIPDGQHGRGSWREDSKGSRTGNRRKTSGHLICLLRRGPHAGGNRLSDADGKDIRSTEAPQWCRTSLHQRTDRSHDWRSNRKLCDARWCDPGRAKSSDRVRRPKSDRADHRTEASGWFPESRVFTGTWISGCHCGASSDERDTF